MPSPLVSFHIINIFAVVPPRFLYPAIDGNTVTIFTIINIAVACCVLVVEMRVRKKEISRGLSQLDSKRAFVR